MTSTLRFSENLFTAVALFFFGRGLFVFILGLPSETNPDPESPLLRAISLLIYFITVFILTLRWKKTFRALRENQWILFLIALAIISILWSSIPDISFRKSIALAGSTLFGIYFGSHYSFDEQLKMMGWAFGASMILSFMFVILLPGYGVMNTEAISGAWQGIYLHKNSLGENMFISFLVFYFLSKRIKKYSFIFKLACVLSIVLIYFSDSATSLISVIFSYLILKLLNYLSLRSKSGVLLILVFLLLAWVTSVLLVVNFSAFLSASNKDITLTGRIPLWESLWEFIRLKFWFGYGYGAFFSGLQSETQLLWRIHMWKPPHAHNGLIAVWLDLGFVGLFIFILGYFGSLGKALFTYLTLKDARALWAFSFLLYTVVYNITEVSFLSINSLNWIISLASIYSLSSAVKPQPQE